MIPRLHYPHQPDDVAAAFVEALRGIGFRGDAEGGPGTRTVHATDNSVYQVPPAAVVFPMDAADIGRIVQVLGDARFAPLVVVARGGGTGTNGQSLTDGIVVDLSRHMNRILSIDPVKRTAIVEAGVVKDQLNAALKPFNLFFAPELSTSNRATIGGMISTDACGQGSCLYGKTSNHVRGIRAILLDGTDWWSRPADGAALAELQARRDGLGAIYRLADEIERELPQRIRKSAGQGTRARGPPAAGMARRPSRAPSGDRHHETGGEWAPSSSLHGADEPAESRRGLAAGARGSRARMRGREHGLLWHGRNLRPRNTEPSAVGADLRSELEGPGGCEEAVGTRHGNGLFVPLASEDHRPSPPAASDQRSPQPAGAGFRG